MSAPVRTQHQRLSSIASDGSRIKVRLGDVRGFFTRWRTVFFWILIVFYAAAPLIKVNGNPLIFIDILHRRFYLFGGTFNAQDVYLGFFFLVGGIVSLLVATAMIGRVWCGWACPQTVFLEGVFRKIERWVEGPKHLQKQLEEGPWNFRKWRVLGTKHALYLVAAILVSNIFISYFVSFNQLKYWVFANPTEHMVAFGWMLAITGVLYFNFAWFREQTCLVVCPYGRLQSVLTDDDTFISGYDYLRGEPRGKNSDPNRGACIDCYRCVDVCPTGIDIREGLQLECIACANCIDACDEVMLKINQPKGLIRYDSLSGLERKSRRFLRPRIFFYLAFLFIFLGVGTLFVQSRRPFEAVLQRQQGNPFTVENQVIRNQYLVHVFNKTRSEARFKLEISAVPGAQIVMPIPEITLGSLEDKRIPIMVLVPSADYKGEFLVNLNTTNLSSGDVVPSSLRFLGP